MLSKVIRALLAFAVIAFIAILAGACVSQKTGEIYYDYEPLLKGNGEPIVLVDNPVAHNVTYEALKTFLLNDTTDEHTYLEAIGNISKEDAYVCGDFAEKLHNNAEAAEIRAGIVYIDLPGYVDHVINVYETTNRGIIFIDDTGEHFISSMIVTPPWMISFGEPKSWDKVAYIEIGKPIGFIEISVAELYGFTYEGYEKWQQDKAEFDELFESYGDEITWNQEQKLRELSDKLGGFFEQEDVANDYQIFWEGHR